MRRSFLLAGSAAVADRFNLGTRVSQAARSVGQASGSALTQPFVGLVENLNAGLSELFESTGALGGNLGSAGADFQEFFTGNRNAIGDFLGGEVERDRAQPPQESILDLNRIFSQAAIRTRTAFTESQKDRFTATNPRQIAQQGGVATGEFGGFGTAQAQETALQRAIRESAERFPQFFRAGA